MSDGLPGNWNEPDVKVLDQLTRCAALAADTEALRVPTPLSRIRNPDGSLQNETGHERTVRLVRASLRVLLANGIITALPLDQWPEYTVIDAPDN